MTTPTPRTDAAVRFVREQFHNDDCPDDHAAYAVAYLGGELSKMERFLAAARAELAQEQMARKHWMGMYAQEREWREAVLNELIVAHIYIKEHETNPKKAIQDAITWNCKVALDPAVSSDAQALIAQERERAKRAEAVAEQCRTDTEIAERHQAAAEALAEANAKDAGRYRYLRSRNKDEVFDNDGIKAGVWIDCTDEDGTLQLLTFEDADAAIDAAIAEGKK